MRNRSHGIPDQLIRTAVLLIALLCCQGLGAQTVRLAHCFGGCPEGTPYSNPLIVRSLYALSFNLENRVADWVAYRVTAGSIGVATNLSRTPLADPYVSATLQPLTGEPATDGQDLALQPFAPLVSFAGTPFWQEVNYLTNWAPRNNGLNRGPWYGLEWAVRNLANRNSGLYVITGPIYDPMKGQQPLYAELPHHVPSGFFKVIVDDGGNVSAFSFDQDLPFHVHHCEQITSIEAVEIATGLDLFPELTDPPAGDLSRALGCY